MSEKALQPIQEIKQTLQRMEPQFKAALPENITPAKFFNVVSVALIKTPDLLQCDRQSLYLAAMQSAIDHLLPDGREAAIIPYGKTAVYQPMVFGILTKLHRTGEILSLSVNVVRQGEQFSHFTDEEGEHLEHTSAFSDGEIVGVYCVLRTKSNGVYVEKMSTQDVEDIRQKSRSKDSPAWKNSWPEMAKKCVIKRLAKRAPLPDKIREVIERDNEIMAPELLPLEPAPREPKKSRVKAIVEASREVAPDTQSVVDEERKAIQEEGAPI